MRKVDDLVGQIKRVDIGQYAEALWERMIVYARITTDNQTLSDLITMNQETADLFTPLELAILKTMITNLEW